MATRGYGRVIDRDLGWKQIKKTCAVLAQNPQAVIGIRGKEAVAQKEAGEGETAKPGVTLVVVASTHEFGSPKAGVPQRSFIRATVDRKVSEYREILSDLKDQLLTPKSGMTPRKALLILGEQVKADIKATIRAGIPPPWSEATRERRIQRAGGAIIAETPLIDTAQLINGITNDVQTPDGRRLADG